MKKTKEQNTQEYKSEGVIYFFKMLETFLLRNYEYLKTCPKTTQLSPQPKVMKHFEAAEEFTETQSVKKLPVLFSVVVLAFVFVLNIIISNADSQKPISMTIDGRNIVFDVFPTIKEGRTLLPLRKVFSELNGEVLWDPASRSITAKKENINMIITLDSKVAIVNNVDFVLDVAPKIIDGRTMVPLRFVAETFNANVDWNSDNRHIEINSLERNKTLQNPAVNPDIMPSKNIFEDKKLELSVRKTLGKKLGILTQKDLDKITILNASENSISSINGIEMLTNLTELDLSSNEIKDIAPISKLVQLKKLNISNNEIKDILPISNLNNLQSLLLSNNLFNNAGVLEKIHSKLEEKDFDIVTIDDKKIKEILKKASKSISEDLWSTDLEQIETLNIQEMQLEDIDFVKHCKNIKTLFAGNNKITDISGLQDLLKLQKLYIFSNGIRDIGPLKNLENLTEINIGSNPIRDVAPIANLTKLEILNLSHCSLVSDISMLANLKSLKQFDIGGAQVSDISVISNFKDLELLNLYYNPITDISSLKGLSKITSFRIKDYKKDEPINKELYDRITLINTRANDIIAKVIKPSYSEFQKEIALHDYIVANTKYDYKNFIQNTVPQDSHSEYGVFVKKVAVCDGYAKAMKILLNKVGIECEIVTGDYLNKNDQFGHAWNIVKINNKYYHLDATFNDGVGDDNIDTISHTYFNLSTDQISKDHLFNKDDYNICEDDSPYYSNNSNYIQHAEDRVFYIENSKLFVRMDNENIGKQFADENILSFNIVDQYVYYSIDADSGRRFVKIKFDGSGKEFICGIMQPIIIQSTADHIYFLDNAVDYRNGVSASKLYRVNKNGSKLVEINTGNEVVFWFTIYDDILIYKSYSFEYDELMLFYIYLEDIPNDMESYFITDDKICSFYDYTSEGIRYNRKAYLEIVDDWVYYSNANDSNNIYKINFDGEEKTKLTEYKSKILEIFGDYLYYIDVSDKNKIYRINIDGSNNMCLE